MSKLVFKAVEIADLHNTVQIQKPQVAKVDHINEEQMQLQTLQEEQEEIKKENERLLSNANKEAEEILANAKAEAERIIKEAEDEAYVHIQKSVEKAKIKESEIFSERAKEIENQKEEAKRFIDKAKIEAEEILANAKKEGYQSGYESGYNDGKTEVARLISRLNVIIEGAIDKREEIIQSAEDQIVRIILIMARKVVKHITQKEERVVIDNVKSVLEKIHGKTEIIIKVNTDDLELTTEHKEEFINMVEGLKHITILEDSRIDRGGCIIEADFGSIDARISTQLEEIENKIRDLAHLTMFDQLVDKNSEDEKTKIEIEQSEEEKTEK